VDVTVLLEFVGLVALLCMDAAAAAVRHGRRSWDRPRQRKSESDARGRSGRWTGTAFDLAFAWAGSCWARATRPRPVYEI
jgi:hypothetical protein